MYLLLPAEWCFPIGFAAAGPHQSRVRADGDPHRGLRFTLAVGGFVRGGRSSDLDEADWDRGTTGTLRPSGASLGVDFDRDNERSRQ